MLRSRVLMAVALLALSACGDSDSQSPEEPGHVEPPGDNQPDHRPNVAGTYDVTGTMSIVLNGQTDVSSILDVVRIEAPARNPGRVQIHLGGMDCGAGIRATMTGETTFSVNEGECPLPPEAGCTSSFRINGGSGTHPMNGALQLGLRGQLEVRCGTQSASAPVSIDVSGSRTGQALPDTRAQVLILGADLATTVRQFADDIRP
ncbi:hypothetical protein HUW62_14455 [Myxococcus sp. AM011]|uniref:hypothetical protein n=2 Tax=Myxococcus TaxID=32 RepID=UPI001595527C|nr:hypothetical protein [Myxococcus sp. AM011]NVJ22421.1 hypothetical protein [Myxococcus sp. AM011]